MPELSKQAEPAADEEAVEEVIKETVDLDAADRDSSDEEPATLSKDPTSDNVATHAASKKKQSKKKKIKKVLTGNDDATTGGESSSTGQQSMSAEVIDQLLKSNPSLQQEVEGMPKEKREATLRKLDPSDLLTGLAIGGKNQKNMASYKFWQTQPVPKFGEEPAVKEGPLKNITPDMVRKEPYPLLDGFEWVTMDLAADIELEEVYELLNGHYVEDGEAMFRFKYSKSFLNWALKPPGWRKEWHVGVRATKSRKLVAFISGVPMQLRVRKNSFGCSEVNFLCIHRKLREKRLTPLLIQEITRRCYMAEVWQAIYTAGIVLPKPVACCRYFHRSIDWIKLHETGFSPLPRGSTKNRQVTKHHLPSNTSIKGLRNMEEKDLDAVQKLLKSYLAKFDMCPEFTSEELEHWIMHKTDTTAEQVVWAYVVEDPGTHEITDFFSFYSLESSVIGNKKYNVLKAAYLFYYATKTGLGSPDKKALKTRLNALINDALILAKQFHFDLFNALTHQDNTLFLEQQRFGAGDGQLNYYLYNYSTAPIASGVNAHNHIDADTGSGVGVVML
ncbi:MAG: glycylpeptide N-tetradecanoyltransferase [Caeruleum heppii]|nr:MAG: glycylpeptide N-tetradecanoyltransferase [Caeruleum heppii]